ncbi:MAG TPA: sodium-translocating pyrophosphatase [Bacteroidales bacterium]|jgi:K(+)-stimulated pyrophosphate-energized sodium pump|nr:sodium-translocating pyrophosphatase [Bacteroidales bacterium]HNY58564.1 sodium-translocating pyrophosphatase [Bacteroidales bacterium]HOC05422.1 sodium-translocating pyrophosphatase [Bacteroidales bacterium]HOH15665.1 sodium-translocating pyrophosphatase [Bacteroidales bacterium]HPH75590.1 sodium-translocating pyrophosphatase [Bacteroidales bacterium]
MIEALFWIAPVASVLALLFAWIFYRSMIKAPAGNERMQEIAGYVSEGAMAYLKRQYSVVFKVFMILVVLLLGLAYLGVQNPFVPLAFLTGGFFSGLCGYLGMKTATMASSRTAQGASVSLNRGLKIAFRSGAVMGLVVVGFGLLDIVLWFLILNYWVFTPEHMVEGWTWMGLTFVHPGTDQHGKMIEITATMLTFGMGASTQALFARVGGGIFTKAADVGADLVGKVEAGIPEDDPRNPATIADNVGDNVGDVAGMGADLYESYAGSILSTAALGAALPLLSANDQIRAIVSPMIVAGVGILLSIAGVYMVRTKEQATQKNLLNALLLGTGGSSALILVAVGILAFMGWISWGVFGAVVAGLAAGVIIGQSTEYFTSDEYKPTRGIAKQTQQGPATTIIEGMAVGMMSSWVPVLTIAIAIIAAYGFAGGFTSFADGVYGIGFAAVGMLSTLGITLATDAFGPIADNAGGNAEMSNLPKEVRERTDALDALGNTTAATGKGFAIGSAALTAMALVAAYIEEVRLWLGRTADSAPEGFKQIGDVLFYKSHVPVDVPEGMTAVMTSNAGIMDFVNAYNLSVLNPLLLGGIFIGAMMAFLFSSLSMKAVGRAAGNMVDEVRRQFREIPGIMDGTGKPEYAKCVAISTRGAQREMLFPSLLAIAVPTVTGIVLGVPGVVGLLVGGMTAGFTLACMLNNAGGAWDNAKKFIEKGNYGGKGSECHKAGVVGDTVGDPFKDTSGPALNILIKLMSMVSVVLAGLTVMWSIIG